MSDTRMSDNGYVQDGAFLTTDDGGIYQQEGTDHVRINFEERDELGSVVEFTNNDGDTYLTDGSNIVYRIEP